jgi:hypothetical protein
MKSNLEVLIDELIAFWDKSELKKCQQDPEYIVPYNDDMAELNRLNNFVERLKSYAYS